MNGGATPVLCWMCLDLQEFYTHNIFLISMLKLSRCQTALQKLTYECFKEKVSIRFHKIIQISPSQISPESALHCAVNINTAVTLLKCPID